VSVHDRLVHFCDKSIKIGTSLSGVAKDNAPNFSIAARLG